MPWSRNRLPVVVTALAASMAGVLAMLPHARSAADDASALFGVTLPAGYRNWTLISVAHEKGNLNDLRAILGNDIAAKAFRDGTRPFPDGAILARLAWQYVASAEDNAVFGQPQSFVAGPPTNVQLSVKDAKRYATTEGWGFGQFEGGKPNHSEALLGTCAPCHARAKASDDFVFTHYAP
jgi:hypothetical protein